MTTPVAVARKGRLSALPAAPVIAAMIAIATTLAMAPVAPASAASYGNPSPWSPTWLCKPGMANDPCAPGLSTTVYTPVLRRIGVIHPKAQKNPPIDCFYVYPTVSGQKTGNASLEVDPEERSIALFQTARYSQYCRVYAPIYRQFTVLAIFGQSTTPLNLALALSDVRAAFKYYLKHFNHGRGFVLIGHSQGTFMLRQLIAKDIDPKPALRARLVSAILLGGNVLVKPGRAGIGGDFKHIPACRAAAQLGCVIAFSTFDQPAPDNSAFGKPGNILGTTYGKRDVVLCTNPAALAGGPGIANPILPTAPFAPGTWIRLSIVQMGFTQPTPAPTTVWLAAPGSYRAQCLDSNGANVLEITPRAGAQTLTPSPSPAWGLHLFDPNVELGNLLEIVKAQSDAFVRRFA